MMTVLFAPMFLLAFAFLPGSVSRLVGAKFAVKILFSTGVFVLPVLVGLTWGAVLAGGCDAALLLAGTSLASRMNLPREICAIWMKRIAAVFSGVLFVVFAPLALLATNVTGQAAYALPFDFGFLMSGIALALLLPHRQEQVFARSGAGQAICRTAIGTLNSADGESCAG